MLGRALFTLVWLIIAAGLALPLYPADVATPGAPAAASALLVADTTASGCPDLFEDAGCGSTCPCAPALAAAAAAEPCVGLTVYLVVRPLPSDPSLPPQQLRRSFRPSDLRPRDHRRSAGSALTWPAARAPDRGWRGGTSMRLLHVVLALALLAAPASVRAATITEATLYKTPWCGCCSEYGRYLERHGFKLRIEEREDLAPIKRAASVPPSLEGCHTLEVGGYVVEGHVPVEVLLRLLRERPAIRGVSCPACRRARPAWAARSRSRSRSTRSATARRRSTRSSERSRRRNSCAAIRLRCSERGASLTLPREADMPGGGR